MRADQLDVMLPTKIVVAMDEHRNRFLGFWTAQAKLAAAEQAAQLAKAKGIGLLRPVQ